MRRILELATAIAGVVALGVLALTAGAPNWVVVLAFGAVVLVGENTAVLVNSDTAVSPGFMLVMATMAVVGDDQLVATAALVGMCNGVYLPYLRKRKFGTVGFNCGQFLLASASAALVFSALADVRLLATVAAGLAYLLVNLGLVVPYAAAKADNSFRTVWHDIRPMLASSFSFGLLGMLVGLVCAELGPVAIVLLAVPVGIGRWTFRSFERTREAHEAAIRVFVRLIEAKDPYTAGHTERVAKYAAYIGEELGLDIDRLEHLRGSALMHDVGKLAVPGRLLNKPGRLTPEEWKVVRTHNDAGIGILGQVDFMRTMAVTASDSHGRFEHGAGDTPPELVLEAHVVAVADAFDAMTSTRPYRKALAQTVAIEELRSHAGTQFNPVCVDALIAEIDRRDEHYGAGYETDAVAFAVAPPEVGVGSAGLGDLDVAR